MLAVHHVYGHGNIQHHIQVLRRWKGGNGPEQTDSIATGNLIRATPKGVKRFVLVTSAGVERFNKLPFSILNLFGKPRYLSKVALQRIWVSPHHLCSPTKNHVVLASLPVLAWDILKAVTWHTHTQVSCTPCYMAHTLQLHTLPSCMYHHVLVYACVLLGFTGMNG